MEFSVREQRHHTDIFPGMFFFFVKNPNPGTQLFDDNDLDRTVPWMVIHKEYRTKIHGGFWAYLLLGPDMRLVWHEGHLQWIRRVADPVFEERSARPQPLTIE